MTELKVVEEGTPPETGLHVRLRYDADSVHASVYDGDVYVIGTGYVFVKSAGGWAEAREKALQETAKKVAIMREFGRPPENETVMVDDLPEVTDA